MSELGGSIWGPLPLPEFLTAQLEAHGFSSGDAAKCAVDLRNVPGRTAAASLFVDLGSCKFLEGDIDGAVAAWRQAITSDHDAAAARALLNMGLMYEHLHLYPRAVTVLSAVADRSVSPHEVQAALALARCQRATGDVEAATETVALLASATMAERPQAPELSEILLALGDLAHGADRPDRAERSWRVAVAGPDSPARRMAASRLVHLSLEQGHDDEFIELLATEDSEQSVATAVLARADGLLRLGHNDRTLELLESIEDHALTSIERFRLADLRVHLGQVNQGIDHYEVLLGSPVPEIWQRAAFALGNLYLDYEMSDVAAEMFDRARSHPDRYWAAKAALARGDLYAMAGDPDRAQVLWTEAGNSSVAAVRAVARNRVEVGLVSPEPARHEALAAATVSRDPGADEAEAASAAPVASPDVVVIDDSVDGITPDLVVIEESGADFEAAIDASRSSSVEDDAVVIDLNALSTGAPSPATPPGRMGHGHEADVVDLHALSVDGGDETSDPDRVDLQTPTDHARASQFRPEAEVVDLHALSIDADDVSAAPTDNAAAEPEPEVIVLVDPEPVISLVEADDQRVASTGQPKSSDEPVVVVLEPLGEQFSEAASVPPSRSVFARLSDLDQPVELTDEVGSYHDGGLRATQDEDVDNPYASLAPDGYVPARSTSNPYAELAPSYDDGEFSPADGVEPGDWESMLDEWPAPQKPASGRGLRRGRPSAFSRYT